jgi:hypothetical protein
MNTAGFCRASRWTSLSSSVRVRGGARSFVGRLAQRCLNRSSRYSFVSRAERLHSLFSDSGSHCRAVAPLRKRTFHSHPIHRLATAWILWILLRNRTGMNYWNRTFKASRHYSDALDLEGSCQSASTALQNIPPRAYWTSCAEFVSSEMGRLLNDVSRVRRRASRYSTMW